MNTSLQDARPRIQEDRDVPLEADEPDGEDEHPDDEGDADDDGDKNPERQCERTARIFRTRA